MKDRFKKLMRDAGLDKYTDDILKLAWNSIRIHTKKAGDWQLLFQLASIGRREMKPEMMWGDLGHLYFCIKKDDLAAKDFSKVWLEHQCA